MKKIIKVLWLLLVLVFMVGYPIYVAEKTNNYNYLWLWVATTLIGETIYNEVNKKIDNYFKK